MIENILANLKIERLNPMQEASINAWKEGKDLILLSPTGSGKTLAYLLPLVQSLKPGITGVQAIVLVPSRELALQIDQVFKSMNTPFKAVKLLWRYDRPWKSTVPSKECSHQLSSVLRAV